MTDTTLEKLPISFSPQALAALHQIAADQQVGPDQGLRVGVKGGGCSGMSYVLGFDAATEHDASYALDGLRVLLDKRHVMYVANMHIEYQDGLNARGFIFVNPNAKTTCGCGTSFAA